MRAAPAVEAALGSGRPERMLIIVLHAGAGAALAAWAMAPAGLLSAPDATGLTWLLGALAVSLMAAVGTVLARRALPATPAQLRWDGVAWRLMVAGGPAGHALARVVVSLDLGAWLLLNLQPAPGCGAAVWRVATAGGAGAAWHGLRVALQAHAGNIAPADRASDKPP